MSQNVGFYWTPASPGDEEQIDFLINSGVNTVFVKHALLEQIPIERLRRHHIQVYVDWGVFAGEKLRRQYPNMIPIDASGLPFERDEWYVPICPNHPQVREQHIQAISELLNAHGNEVSGLWLDFIRFPVRWEVAQPEMRMYCFCEHCLNLFLQTEHESYSPEETKRLAGEILSERLEEWIDWKCLRITEFVRETRRQITTRNLPVRLGMFTLPWRRAESGGAIRTVAGQDLGNLASYVDVFSPMVYHKLCHQPASWIRDVVEDVLEWTQKPVLPIVQSLNAPDRMTPEQLGSALTYALSPATEGVMIFTHEPVLASKELATVVRTHFKNL